MKKPDKTQATQAMLDAIAVMEAEIQEHEARIAVLKESIASSRRTVAVLNGGKIAPSNSSSVVKPNFTRQKYPRPIGDAAEEILREAGTSLTMKVLLDRLAEQGITPTSETLSSVLLKDNKKRFKGISRGVYDLAERVNPSHGEDSNQLPLAG